jgi:hypothetical protein
MTDTSNIGYKSGCGKPVYLLDRTKYEPSIGSDYGVSGLFDISPTIGTLSSFNTSHAFSRLSKSSTAGGLSTLSDFIPSSFEYKSSSNMSYIYGGSAETRTTRNDNLSNLTDNWSMGNVHQQTYEMSKLLSPSFMNTSSDLPVCLRKDEDYSTNVSSNYDYDSNVSCEPENMFPPYSRLFSDDEDESQQKQQMNNTGGLFHIINKSTAFFNYCRLDGF